MRTCVVNAHTNLVAEHPIPDGVEFIEAMQWVQPTGVMTEPANLAAQSQKATLKCRERGLSYSRTCNGQFAIVQASEGRFPAQGLNAADVPEECMGPEFTYSEKQSGGVIYKDIRRRFLLENESVRDRIASLIASKYMSRSNLFIDGVYNCDIAGSRLPVSWDNWCDFLRRIRDNIAEERILSINCAGTLQAWQSDMVNRLAASGVQRVTFEQYLVAGQRDAKDLRNAFMAAGYFENYGINAILLRTALSKSDADYQRNYDWGTYIAENSNALVNVTL